MTLNAANVATPQTRIVAIAPVADANVVVVANGIAVATSGVAKRRKNERLRTYSSKDR